MFKNILRELEEKNVVLLTGPGGTGKTYNINKICEEVGKAARTATTGIAATHISGETIHRFSGIGAFQDPESFFKITRSRFFADTQERINEANIIIIDEVSMLHRKQFDLIDRVFQYACYSDLPFGGKKVLLSGDFMQLPPVNKDVSSPWIFHSHTWEKLNPKVIELTKIWRQEDKEFSSALMNIRKGICGDVEDEMIRSRVGADFGDIKPTKLVATNREAEYINNGFLREIDGQTHTYEAEVEVRGAVTEKQEQFLKNNMIRDMIAPQTLHLKVGAQVMVLKNGEGYCNGTLGTVIELGRMGVRIETTDGNKIRFEREEWKKLDTKDREVATFSQIPLKLAYAITVHKSQGMTLDYAEIDFGQMFAPGQAYVALSRVKSLEGLSALNWEPRVVFCDRNAFNFYYGDERRGAEAQGPRA